MGIQVPESLKKYGGILKKGFLIDMAPVLAKGALVEVIRIKKVDVAQATKWVETNTSLWDVLEPKYQERLRHLAHRVGNVRWLTTEWVIEAIRHDFPALASLFLGWRKAKNWLGRQVEIIKRNVSEEAQP